MSAMASQITGVSTVCSNVGLDVDKWKHQSSASLAFVRGIHRWPVNSPHKRPVTRKMFPFDDVIIHTELFAKIVVHSSWKHIKDSAFFHLHLQHVCGIYFFICHTIFVPVQVSSSVHDYEVLCARSRYLDYAEVIIYHMNLYHVIIPDVCFWLLPSRWWD